MALSISLYLYAGCSLRGVPKVLELFYKFTSGGSSEGQVPSYGTVKTWIEKCGLSKYNGPVKDATVEDVCYIVDESISVNKQKLGLILECPAKPEGKALTAADARVVGMSVKPSRDSEEIAKEIKAAADANRKPSYIVGDGGKNLVGGAAVAGLTYHVDCSHHFANIMKKVYGNSEDFNNLSTAVGRTRRNALTETAYLMPPSMRTVARYMNLTAWLDWAYKIINVGYDRLNSKEKTAYSFLMSYADIISELRQDMSVINETLKILKHEGLSLSSTRCCEKLVSRNLLLGTPRQNKLGTGMIAYLYEELNKMPDRNVPTVISSDIIESFFGYDKSKMSKNKLNGFTTMVLTMPLVPVTRTAGSFTGSCVQELLKATTVNDVILWRTNNLIPNCVNKRKEVLGA